MKRVKTYVFVITNIFLMVFLSACSCQKKQTIEETTTISKQIEEVATSEAIVNAKSAEVIFTDEELEQFRLAEEMAKKEKETIVETTKPVIENKESTGFDKGGLPYLSQQKFDGWQYVEVNNEIVAKSNNAQIDYVFNTILGEAKEDPIEETRNKK